MGRRAPSEDSDLQVCENEGASAAGRGGSRGGAAAWRQKIFSFEISLPPRPPAAAGIGIWTFSTRVAPNQASILCSLVISHRGHTGSVKSVSARPSDESVFATGSRDGNLALWDSRQPATRCARTGALYTAPTHQVMAHATGRRPRRRRGIAGDTQQSVTQVMFLRDDALLASAGAADGTVKLWDVRALKKPVAALGAATEWGAATAASSPATLHQRRLHGVCAIAQDDGGGRLVVARANDACYMYDVLRPENGPVARYAGAALRSFYIKADFAPGGTHFATGSSDRQVHIFEVDSPEDGPYTLQGHASEVTAVAWCKADVGRLATAADDGTVRVWSLERSGHGAVGIADEDVIDDPLHSAAKRGALVKRHRRALSAQARSMHGGRRVFGAPFRLDFSSPGRGDATAVPDDAEAAPAVAWAASAVVSSKDGHAEAPARAPSPSPGGAVPNKRPRVQTDIASFFGRISS